MSFRYRMPLMGAMTLIVVGIGLALAAKPPDLPANVQVDCVEEQEAAPAPALDGQAVCRLACDLTCGFPCRLAVEYVTGCGNSFHSAAQAAAPCMKRMGVGCGRLVAQCLNRCSRQQTDEQPCGEPCQVPDPCCEECEVIEVMPTEVEVLEVMPAEAEVLEVMPTQLIDSEEACEEEVGEVLPVMPAETEAIESMPEAEPIVPLPPVSSPCCPYLKQQAASKCAPKPMTAEEEQQQLGSVLDNLERLHKAAELCDKGDAFTEQGDYVSAWQCYEAARYTCLGSRWELIALEKLEAMAVRAVQAPIAEDSAEQEAAQGDRRTNIMHAPKLTLFNGQTSTEPMECVPQPCRPDAQVRLQQLLERCQQAVAEENYDEADKLMHRAAWRLWRLQRQQERTKSPTPPEPAPVPAVEEESEFPGCSANPGVMGQVEKLLADCHDAMQSGDFALAAQCAHQALALDPTCVAADGLVYKTHMLIQLEQWMKDCEEAEYNPCIPQPYEECMPPAEPPSEADDSGCVYEMESYDPPSSCDTEDLQWIEEEWYRIWETQQAEPLPPGDEEQEDPCEALPFEDRGAQAIEPSLPPIDPLIADVLERILDEAESRAVLDEPGAEEESEEIERGSGWPYDAFDGMPNLDLPPEEKLELILEGEEDCEQDAKPRYRSLGEVLRQAIDQVQQGNCIEVDVNGSGNVRFRCEMQIGGVQCRVLQDAGNHVCVIMCSVPQASSDLRDLQRAQDQAVLDWIESMQGDLSGGEEESEPRDDEFDLEDWDLLEDPRDDL